MQFSHISTSSLHIRSETWYEEQFYVCYLITSLISQICESLSHWDALESCHTTSITHCRFVIVMTNLDTPPTPTRAKKVRNCPLRLRASQILLLFFSYTWGSSFTSHLKNPIKSSNNDNGGVWCSVTSFLSTAMCGAIRSESTFMCRKKLHSHDCR